MEPRLFTATDGENLAALINVSCQGKRHFMPISGKVLAETLGRGRRKEFGQLFVLGEGEFLRGACHVFFAAEERIGYIAYFLALPGEESTTWPLLLKAALNVFPRATKFTFGSPYTPLYQAVEGRVQPLWGSTETLEVNNEDIALRTFLFDNHFVDVEDYVTLSKSLHDLPQENESTFLTPVDIADFELLRGDDCWYNAYDWYGRTSAEEFGLRNKSLSVLVQRKGHKIMGHTAWYPMRQGGRAVFCDFEVAIEARRHGLGRLLLSRTLQQMKLDGYLSCELFTSASESVHANALYLSHGFQTEAEWHEMST